MDESEFSDRLWNFAARIGEVVEALPETRLGRHVAEKLVRCGTASAPNYDEGRSAAGRENGAPHLTAAIREMRETGGWLEFIGKAKLLPLEKVSTVLHESRQLLEMLAKSQAIRRRPEWPAPVGNPGGDPQPPISHLSGFRGLDHVAIVVPDTDSALKIWRDKFGFPVLYAEEVNQGTVRLTHLDLGNTHLQLVEPLTREHPLQAWLVKNGPGLNHFCLRVDDVGDAILEGAQLDLPAARSPHQGTQGKRAVFLDPAQTQGVQVELTGQ